MPRRKPPHAHILGGRLFRAIKAGEMSQTTNLPVKRHRTSSSLASKEHRKLVEACRGIALLTWTINVTPWRDSPRRPLVALFVPTLIEYTRRVVVVARETKIERIFHAVEAQCQSPEVACYGARPTEIFRLN